MLGALRDACVSLRDVPATLCTTPVTLYVLAVTLLDLAVTLRRVAESKPAVDSATTLCFAQNYGGSVQNDGGGSRTVTVEWPTQRLRDTPAALRDTRVTLCVSPVILHDLAVTLRAVAGSSAH